MSPEQARGEIGHIDQRTDIYALGAMLYEILAGHRAYCHPGSTLTAQEIRARVILGSPAALGRESPLVAPELVAICTKAMARDRASRYQTVEAFVSDLNAFVEQRVVAAYQTGPWAEARKW